MFTFHFVSSLSSPIFPMGLLQNFYLLQCVTVKMFRASDKTILGQSEGQTHFKFNNSFIKA